MEIAERRVEAALPDLPGGRPRIRDGRTLGRLGGRRRDNFVRHDSHDRAERVDELHPRSDAGRPPEGRRIRLARRRPVNPQGTVSAVSKG